jgi:L-asparaginase
MARKKIHIIFTGGTISMRIDEKTGGAVPALSGSDILKMIPEIDRFVDIEIYDFGKFPGPHITPALMLKLTRKIESFVKDKSVSGVVVTHGTDSLEETAYFVDLMLKTEKPIVMTGSMKSSDEIGWDGLPNLLDAVAVASSPKTKGLGVLTVMNNDINAASEVTKMHTDQMGTFQSADFGALGIVDKRKVYIYRRPEQHDYIGAKKIEPRVELLKCYAGMSGDLIRYAVQAGCKGLVIETMGRGNVPPPAFEALKAVIGKIPVVITSRCPRGRTLDTYSYYGAGKDLRKIGAIFADHLNGQKARIKLLIVLGKTKDRKAIKSYFEYGRY